VQRADGSGVAERLTKPEPGVSHVPESWSPGGKHLLFAAVKNGTFSAQLLSLAAGKVTAFADLQSLLPINAAFSPDGRWVAYTLSPSPASRTRVFLLPFPASGTPYHISKGTDQNAHHPFWSRDGREFYYIPGATQYAVVSVTTAPRLAFSDPASLPRGQPAFSEGGPANTRQTDHDRQADCGCRFHRAARGGARAERRQY
jgi:Tol biopolymer transport system component